jgi:tripeptidyl-peptidase-1
MKNLVGASEETLNKITTWLKSQGVSDVRIGRSHDMVFAKSISLGLASQLLGIKFHTYRHLSGLSFDASVGPYSLPASIAEHIDLVSGAVGFPDMAGPKVKVNPTPKSGPRDMTITPTVIRARYNISSTLVGTNSGNMHAVAEFQAQYYAPTDLKQFWSTYVPFAPFQAVAGVVGQNDPTSPGVEASLDIEYLMGVAPNITTYFYSLKNFNFYNDLLTWTGELDNETNPPFINSVSYGSQGDYPTDSYRSRLNNEFMKLGARGLSIIFASGDDGAGCQGDGVTAQSCDCTFYPSFPATCPYVTTIGATRFLNGNSGPEGAVEAFKSGGGFSQYFQIPTYQSSDVTSYLQSGVQMPEACAFNASGRATPDAAALGDVYFQVVNGGNTISVGGTSASAPTFSAVMSLLNDQLLNEGKSVLGFLNPWIYQTAASSPKAFFDVTVGDNINSGCCSSGAESGFECATGWDPVTGVGTPNFAVLSNLI